MPCLPCRSLPFATLPCSPPLHSSLVTYNQHTSKGTTTTSNYPRPSSLFSHPFCTFLLLLLARFPLFSRAFAFLPLCCCPPPSSPSWRRPRTLERWTSQISSRKPCSRTTTTTRRSSRRPPTSTTTTTRRAAAAPTTSRPRLPCPPRPYRLPVVVTLLKTIVCPLLPETLPSVPCRRPSLPPLPRSLSNSRPLLLLHLSKSRSTPCNLSQRHNCRWRGAPGLRVVPSPSTKEVEHLVQRLAPPKSR